MRRLDEERTLRAVVEGTASGTGTEFYRLLAQNLAHALDTHGAWVTEYDETTERLRALAFWFGGRWIEGYEYAIAGTACEVAIKETRLVHVPDEIVGLYPRVPAGFPDAEIVSYLGAPLLSADGRILGHVAVVDVRPMPAEKRLASLFEIFANRAVAEMRRLRLENDLRERQEKLSRLIDSAMDAIVEFDGDMRITLMNAAAEKIFGETADRLRGQGAERLLGALATRKLAALAEQLEHRPESERCLWIPDGFAAQPPGRNAFPAEATLSKFEMRGRSFYTLILRNIDDRIEAERTIRTLSAQAAYLREEIDADHGFDEIVGGSPALRAALTGVAQVAPTDATVLLLGETGTGKELFARAIHNRSARKDKPLIKVNCAAIPPSLIESEFFGHEKGAFTGATQRRDGRFALADGGTIFLDEIGEIPLELQGKLLRVLQEGEFEPVGGARARKVDVRVVAATNRDLEREVRDGGFRGDLFYRLNVFPLRLPPLRDRGDDVVLLAEAVARRLAHDLGKTVGPLSASDVIALKSYSWPGNARELRNVVERALIKSTDGHLRLHDILPDARTSSIETLGAPPPPSAEVLTDAELRRLERENMIAALERTGWRIGGDNGAAELLGIGPSTFKSRMKALAIARASGT
jgi:PAS domain S-box-containing protein